MVAFSDFVVPPFLASKADWAAWVGVAVDALPANATLLLRSATSVVLEATVQAYYDVDSTTGLATSATISKALNDATCIQAAALSALGFDPLTGGVLTTGTVSSAGIGTAKETYSDGVQVTEARASAITDLVPEARRRLALQNLLAPGVWIFG